MSSKDKGKQNLKQSDYEYLKVPKEHFEIVLEELALVTMHADKKVIEVIDSIVHHKKESPIFVAIMQNGTLEVIRIPTMYNGKSNPDVIDYMDAEYGHDLDYMVVDNFRNIQLEKHINHDLNVGDLVITTNAQEEGDFMEKGQVWIHAEKGDTGIVEYVSYDGYPTVRFKKSGTATLVAVYELVAVKDIGNIIINEVELLEK